MDRTSIERLNTVHPDLQVVVNVVAKRFPIYVVTGHRGKEAQNEAYREGNSTLKYPESKHNKKPSLAVDIAPLDEDGSIPWGNINGFYFLAGYAKAVAEMMGIKVRSGADWDGDYRTNDQRFHDPGHLELLTGE